MTGKTQNTQATREQRGSGNPNMELQKREERNPNRSNARDREGRKGGDNAENL